MKKIITTLFCIVISINVFSFENVDEQKKNLCHYLSEVFKCQVYSYTIEAYSKDSINLINVTIYDKETKKMINWNKEKIKLEWFTRNPNIPISSAIRGYVNYDSIVNMF